MTQIPIITVESVNKKIACHESLTRDELRFIDGCKRPVRDGIDLNKSELMTNWLELVPIINDHIKIYPEYVTRGDWGDFGSTVGMVESALDDIKNSDMEDMELYMLDIGEALATMYTTWKREQK